MEVISTTRLALSTLAVGVAIGLAAPADGSNETPGQGEANKRKPVETITARTANLDPSGEGVRFNVLRWSSEDDRRKVLNILMAPRGENEDEDAPTELKALLELPTLGYLWPESGGVGYSLKYANRVEAPGGSERITFVTGRRLGTFGRDPWLASDVADPEHLPFTVIELRLDRDGYGEGKMSVASEVLFDRDAATVALEDYDTAPVLLETAEQQPLPYWARGD